MKYKCTSEYKYKYAHRALHSKGQFAYQKIATRLPVLPAHWEGFSFQHHIIALIHEIDMFTLIFILAIQEERQGALWGRSAFSRTVSKTPWCLLLFRVFIQPFIFQTPLSQASFLLSSHCIAFYNEFEFALHLNSFEVALHLSNCNVLDCSTSSEITAYYIIQPARWER